METSSLEIVCDLLARGNRCFDAAPAEGRAAWMRNYWPKVAEQLEAYAALLEDGRSSEDEASEPQAELSAGFELVSDAAPNAADDGEES